MRRPRLRRDGDGRLRVALTVVTLLLVVVVWGALLLRAGEWTAQWLLVGVALVHYVLWLAPVAVLLAVLNRRLVTAGVAALATVLVLVVQVPPTVSRDAAASRDGITVLQANLKIGAADPVALVRRVRDEDVDLLATEELTTAAASGLVAAGLPKLLPYRYLRPLRDGGSGSGIWSRWPLSGTQDVPGFYLSTVRARVASPRGPLTFMAVHLTPPWPFPAWRWVDEMGRLRALLREQPRDAPVIAAGDYNATVDHAQFRALLAGGYTDAADDAGAGYLRSYPADRWYGPVIAIDHVLLCGVTGVSADTLDLPGSDHRALLVRTTAP